MESLKASLSNLFPGNTFRRTFYLTWIFILIGIVLLILFFSLARIANNKSFIYFFIQNIGVFFMFTSLILAYSGVYFITTSSRADGQRFRLIFTDSIKRAPAILCVTLGAAVFLFVLALLEVGLSMISHIPYAGPGIISLLTIPLFLINLASLLLAISIVLLVPPMICDGKSIRDIFTEMKSLVKGEWISIILYIIMSFALLLLFVYIGYYLVKYAVGITKAVQWKIGEAYPAILKGFVKKSYISDVIARITPNPDPISAFKKYGFEIFKYVDILKYIIGISYALLMSFLISFPFSIFFRMTSAFSKSISGKSSQV